MRLRPRADSSDRDEARAIAQRLARASSAPSAPAAPAGAGYVSLGRGSGPVAIEPPAGPVRDGESDPPPAQPAPAATPHEPAAAAVEPEPPPEQAVAGDPEPAPLAPPPASDDALAALTEPEPPAAIPDEAPPAGIEPAPPPEPPPTWESRLDRALARASADAAMLIDLDAALIAASGAWPAGAAAIAGKLGPMVIPRLAAPGVMMPVKLGGQVLTAWRLEAEGRPLIVALLARQPIAADARPEIEASLLG